MKKRNKKILILAGSFPPENTSGSLRPAMIAKYLKRNGWNPVVVRAKPCKQPYSVNDPEFLPEVQKMVFRTIKYRPDDLCFEVISTLVLWKKFFENRTERTFFELVNQSMSTVLKFPRRLLQRVAVKRRPYNRPIDLYKQYKKILSDLAKLKPALIISTAPPPAVHAIASEFAKTYSIPWIADFRDDALYQKSQLHLWRYNDIEYVKRVEVNLLNEVQQILTVSPALTKGLQHRHGQKVRELPNAYDSDLYPSVNPKLSDIFTISYTGVVVYPQDIGPVLDALDQLVAKGVFDESRFRLNVFGSTKDKIDRLKKGRICAKLVNTYGNVSRERALRVQTESHILLHLSHPKEKGILTGKLFEYLGAKRPILTVPGDRDCVEKLLNETSAGFACRNSDEIAATIKSKYMEWEENGRIKFNAKINEVNKHSWNKRIIKLDKMIENILGNENTNQLN